MGKGILILLILVFVAGMYVYANYGSQIKCLINSGGQINSCFNKISTPQPTNITATSYIIVNKSYANKQGVSQYKIQNATAYAIAKKYNETIKNEYLFTGEEMNATIQIRNAEIFTPSMNLYVIKYHNLYIPTHVNLLETYISNSSYLPSLIGKKVYISLDAVYDNNSTIQAPYIVKSENVVMNNYGKLISWNLSQDTGISNSTAINVNLVLNETTGNVIGIYYDGTEILFPNG